MKIIYVSSLTEWPDRDSSWINSCRALGFTIIPFQYAHRDSPRRLDLHTLLSASNMLRTANFAVRGIREYGVAFVLGATINNCSERTASQLTLKVFFILSPIYHLIEFFARRGEVITLWAIK